MQVRVDNLTDATWIVVSGGIEPGDQDELGDLLARARAAPRVVLDLREVEVFGAAAVRLVVEAGHVVGDGDVDLRLLLPERATRVLEACHLGHVLRKAVAPDQIAALPAPAPDAWEARRGLRGGADMAEARALQGRAARAAANSQRLRAQVELRRAARRAAPPPSPEPPGD